MNRIRLILSPEHRNVLLELREKVGAKSFQELFQISIVTFQWVVAQLIEGKEIASIVQSSSRETDLLLPFTLSGEHKSVVTVLLSQSILLETSAGFEAQIQDLMEKTGLSTKKALINSALTFIEWAVLQTIHGRNVVAIERMSITDWSAVIHMPCFEAVKRYESDSKKPKLSLVT